MVRATRRPFGVTFTVIWGLVLAGLLVTRGVASDMVPAVVPQTVASGTALLALQGAAAFLLLVVSALVFKLVSWSRRLAMAVFTVAGVATGATLVVEFSIFAFVVLMLDAATVFMLAMNAEAFRSGRPDIDDSGSAAKFGAP